MDMTKYSGSSFIKVADVEDGPIPMQIAVVREGKFGKPELIGKTGDVFSVNATNNKTLVRAYGKNSDAWVGKEIELHLGEIEYQGEKHPAVLILPISPPLKPKPEAPTSTPKPDFDDEIPRR